MKWSRHESNVDLGDILEFIALFLFNSNSTFTRRACSDHNCCNKLKAHSSPFEYAPLFNNRRGFRLMAEIQRGKAERERKLMPESSKKRAKGHEAKGKALSR
jgi:hypothetical protein